MDGWMGGWVGGWMYIYELSQDEQVLKGVSFLD